MNPTCTAFSADQRIASGELAEVARAVKQRHDRDAAGMLVFNDQTGEVVDLDLRGTVDDVISRLPNAGERRAAEVGLAQPPVRLRGRPRLGVAAREVTLLPRHWDWLGKQSGGASAALRRLVEQALRINAEGDTLRASQEATYRVMHALAGQLPGYEEALRALYAPDPSAFASIVGTWPVDISHYVRRLGGVAFEWVENTRVP